MLNAQVIGEFERQYLSLEANSAEEVSQWVSQRHKGFRSAPLEKSRPGPVARFARAEIDELSLVSFRWNQAFQSDVLEDLDAYFICVPHSGTMKMQTAQDDEIVQTTEKLRVFKRTEGLKNTVAAGYSNLSLVVPANLLEKRLEGLIDQRLREPLTFTSLIDASQGPGGAMVSFAAHLLSLTTASPEILDNDILKSNIKEHLLSVMFEFIPHNYSRALHAGSVTAIPGTVKRSEDYMREFCAHAVTIEDLAKVAGCSARSLYAAFKTFRETTPMAVLCDIRLEAAHEEIIREMGTVTEIAAKYGFSNAGRFARQYARKFGQKPSQSRLTGAADYPISTNTHPASSLTG